MHMDGHKETAQQCEYLRQTTCIRTSYPFLWHEPCCQSSETKGPFLRIICCLLHYGIQLENSINKNVIFVIQVPYFPLESIHRPLGDPWVSDKEPWYKRT